MTHEPDLRFSCQARRDRRSMKPCGKPTELGYLGLGLCLSHWNEITIIQDDLGLDGARRYMFADRYEHLNTEKGPEENPGEQLAIPYR